MNKKTKRLLIFSIIILIIALIFFIYAKVNSGKVKGDIVSVTDTHEITDETIKENKEKEKNLAKVVIYWDMEHKDETAEIMNLFNNYYANYSDKIYFASINSTDNQTKVAAFLSTSDSKFINTDESNIDVLKNIEVASYPTLVFIQKDGTILSLLDKNGTVKPDGTKTKFTIKEASDDSIHAYLDLLAENY